MAWIELHQSLPGHRKTMRLKRILKIGQAQAIGHLCMLWLWCLDNCPDGDLSSLLDCEIAEAAGYDKKPEDFTAALRESGFLDENNQVHDWYSYAGKLIEKREQNANRMRERRARAEHVQRTCSARADNVHEKCTATVPNRTVPNRTQPNSSSGGDAPDWNPFGEAPERPPDTVEAYIADKLATPINSALVDDLNDFEAQGLELEAVRYAVDLALNARKPRWDFTRGIVQNWLREGIKTLDGAKAAQKRHDDEKATKTRAAPKPAGKQVAATQYGQRQYDAAAFEGIFADLGGDGT